MGAAGSGAGQGMYWLPLPAAPIAPGAANRCHWEPRLAETADAAGLLALEERHKFETFTGIQ
ncbi:hypothetical protein UY3_06127 [Chelonia mydas]|uniref:Uncharacterized protein n=1 Tax=Chelonia mydas TaxID=8469 RepID=M7BFM5_CHEMY|nr:hypothetical protein UY3_06127 [Chelonia mydas]